MSGFDNPAHPIWSLARFALVVGSFTTFVMWVGAENFGEDDIMKIVGIVSLLLGYKGMEIRKAVKNGEQS